MDATEPVTLSRYVEFEIAHLRDNSLVRLAAPMIGGAIDRCRKQIEARVNLPWAWASLGLLELLINRPFEAVEAVAQLIRLCGQSEATAAGLAEDRDSSECRPASARALVRTRDALGHIQCIRESLPGFDWCERTVLLGLAVGLNDARAAAALSDLAAANKGRPSLAADDRIVLLSGACSPEMHGAVDAFRPLLLRACDKLSFTLLSGGKTSGIAPWPAMWPSNLAGASGPLLICLGRRPEPSPVRWRRWALGPIFSRPVWTRAASSC